jgi:hypothetical protein
LKKKYFIPVGAISREMLSALRIRFSERTCVSNEGIESGEATFWLISESGLGKIKLAGYIASSSHMTYVASDDMSFLSDDVNLYIAVLRNPDGSLATADTDPRSIKTIKVHRWNGSARQTEFIKILSEVLQPAIGKNILIDVPHGSRTNRRFVQDLAREDTFCVSLWSSPDTGNCVPPITAYGYQIPTRDAGNFGPYMEGEPIVTDEGDEIAAVSDRMLCIYFDICHSEREENIAILKAICKQAARILVDGPSEYNAELAREAYVKACSSRFDKTIDQLTIQIKDYEDAVRDHQKNLLLAIRNSEMLKREIDSLSEGAVEIRDRLVREFNALLRIPKIEFVKWRGNNMIARTKDLYCIDERTGCEHHIGKFDVFIDNTTTEARFINLTHKIHGYATDMNAPHVFADGRACLGNMQEVLPKLIATYEWSAAVQVCLAFLQSVNVADSAGTHINKWPISRTKEQIKADKEAARKEKAKVLEEGAISKPDTADTEADTDHVPAT